MVQIKTTIVALVAATVIAPAVAAPYYYYAEDGLVAREDFDEYNDVLARDYGYDLEEREYADELFEREFDDGEFLERELDDLFERNFPLGHPSGPNVAREFDDEMEIKARGFDDEMEIDAREPEAKYEELLQRYFDDLYERELMAEAEAEIAARELDSEDFELFERSPGIDVIGWIKNLFHPKKKADSNAASSNSTTSASTMSASPTSTSTTSASTTSASTTSASTTSASTASAPKDTNVGSSE